MDTVCHDATLVDPRFDPFDRFDRFDALGRFRETLASARLEEHVVAIVGRSTTVAALWNTPLAMVFIDGGHTDEAGDPVS